MQIRLRFFYQIWPEFSVFGHTMDSTAREHSLTYLRESVTVWLTSCLACWDLAALIMFTQQQINLFG